MNSGAIKPIYFINEFLPHLTDDEVARVVAAVKPTVAELLSSLSTIPEENRPPRLVRAIAAIPEFDAQIAEWIKTMDWAPSELALVVALNITEGEAKGALERKIAALKAEEILELFLSKNGRSIYSLVGSSVSREELARAYAIALASFDPDIMQSLSAEDFDAFFGLLDESRRVVEIRNLLQNPEVVMAMPDDALERRIEIASRHPQMLREERAQIVKIYEVGLSQQRSPIVKWVLAAVSGTFGADFFVSYQLTAIHEAAKLGQAGVADDSELDSIYSEIRDLTGR